MRIVISNIVRVSLGITVFVGFMLFTDAAFAYKLIPLSVEMSPTGSGARQSFRIENTSEVPIAIELKMFSRSMTVDGVDKLKLVNDDFIIHPAQAIVMPGKTQVVRLQWIGNPRPEKEMAFRMITEQMPVSFETSESEGGKLKLLIKFIASVYVVPRNSHANIKISKISSLTDAQGKAQIKLRLSNTGTAHVLLRNASLIFKSENSEIILNPDELPMLASQNILAGHERVFIVPRPPGLANDNLNISINYKGQ